MVEGSEAAVMASGWGFGVVVLGAGAASVVWGASMVMGLARVKN